MMKHRGAALALMLAAAALGAPGLSHAASPQERGAYLVHVMGCGDCHTPGSFLGKPDMTRRLAGGDVGFVVPGLGYFWGPNLTSDAKTGLGAWTQAEIVAALRTGTTPGGRILSPNMPWREYAGLTDDDANAIAAYLKSLPPVERLVPGPLGPNDTPKDPYLAVVFPK